MKQPEADPVYLFMKAPIVMTNYSKTPYPSVYANPNED